jgi:DNA-directed RNA polymerase alpha subunit
MKDSPIPKYMELDKAVCYIGLPDDYLQELADAGMIPFIETGKNRKRLFNPDQVAKAVDEIARSEWRKCHGGIEVPEETDDWLKADVKAIGWSARTENSLRECGIKTIRQLCQFSVVELLRMRGLGPALVREIRRKLSDRRLHLQGDCIPSAQISEEARWLKARLDTINLSRRSLHALRKAGIETIGQLCDLSESQFERMRMKNFGDGSRAEVKAELAKRGLRLRSDCDPPKSSDERNNTRPIKT